MFSFERQVDAKRSKKIVAVFPTGLQVLPEPGGLLDQPYRLLQFFMLFWQGERRAAQNQLENKQG